MAKLLLKNARVIDPANNLDEIRDILVDNSRIAKVARNITNGTDQTIDCTNKIVMPGIIDMHVHLRQPGREDKETVASGTQAAAKGGVTTVLAMANTQPAIDCPENVALLGNIIKESAKVNVLMTGAISKGRLSQELVDIVRLKKEGALAISDDGSSVDSDELFLRALKKAKDARCLVICHSEDKVLSAAGVVNLGEISTRLGLKGISNESEYKRVQRDIRLAEKARCPVHIAHLSCAESVEIIAKAKKRGLEVTCETAPHYFALSEEAVLEYDTNMKMNPPLRSQKDREAIKEGLARGVIDVIASDHAPHTISDKEIEFDRAEFGVIGLETELAISITELVLPGLLSWSELVKKLSLNPAKILRIDKGSLSPGKIADITVVDAQKEWIVQKEDFVSKSKNSAFIGKKLKGVVEYTICSGKIAYKA
jgi:dihydroorotase